MNITPVIPDGYNGPVKQLTCRICKHLFYLAMADYERLHEVFYCHECSLILLEELERNPAAPGSTAPGQAPRPVPLPVTRVPGPAYRPPEPASASLLSALHVPPPRSIDRDKMTIAQLLEEAKMLDKTWRYREALVSYEQALQRDPGCVEAFYGKGEMLSQLGRTREALAAYNDILQLDPTAARAWGRKGTLSSHYIATQRLKLLLTMLSSLTHPTAGHRAVVIFSPPTYFARKESRETLMR